MPRGRKPNKSIELNEELALDPTSSLNKYFMCTCTKRFPNKKSLIPHIIACTLKNNKNKRLVCHWCKLEFKNRGNLNNHARFMHGAIIPKRPDDYKCDGCDETFSEKWKMKFHVRRDHFNLWAKIPLADGKQINQVWFEPVLNTDRIVEITKTGYSRLVMKPTSLTKDIEVQKNYKRIDLRQQYPLRHARVMEQCKICGKTFRKMDMKKHVDETHFNIAKHKCNNCNVTFKRSYLYLQHVCNKFVRKSHVRGVRHVPSSSIRIASVGTLKSVDAAQC